MIQKLTSLSMGKGATQQAPNQNQTHNAIAIILTRHIMAKSQGYNCDGHRHDPNFSCNSWSDW